MKCNTLNIWPCGIERNRNASGNKEFTELIAEIPCIDSADYGIVCFLRDVSKKDKH